MPAARLDRFGAPGVLRVAGLPKPDADGITMALGRIGARPIVSSAGEKVAAVTPLDDVARARAAVARGAQGRIVLRP